MRDLKVCIFVVRINWGVNLGDLKKVVFVLKTAFFAF